MGMEANSSCIRDTCEGKVQHSAAGYFWRWRGSNNFLRQLHGYKKSVQIRNTKKGPVVREFHTASKAADWLGVDLNSVCGWCREESFRRGFHWSYKLTPSVSEEWHVLGKRICVQRRGKSEMREGTVKSYGSESKRYTILFDSGEDATVNLKKATFDWKNDQGQKRVEQLCLKTEEVLRVFDSISEAAHECGCATSRISAVLAGKRNASHGFFWRYHGSSALPSKGGQRSVEKLCLKTERLLATYNSIQEAAKDVGITSSRISYCCNGRNGSKSAGGFRWRFAETEHE